MNQRKPRFFYGYIVVAAAIFTMIIIKGTDRTFGVFLAPMLDEFGWTTAMTSGAFTLASIVTASLGILAGRMSDRFGPRIVLSFCGLFVGMGVLLMSQISNIWQLYLFFGVIVGIGMSGAQAPIMSTIARWFTRRQGVMMGLIGAGNSLGGTIVPLLASWLTTTHDWRFSATVVGAMALTLVVLSAQFLKRNPQQMGLLPYGSEHPSVKSNNISEERPVSARDAIATRQFWMLVTVFFLDMLLASIVIVHIIVYAIGKGIPPVTAAGILSAAAGISIVGKITIGFVADRIGSRRATMLSLALASISFLLLIVSSNIWMFFLFALVFGIGGWASGLLMSIMVVELFGTKSHGTVYATAHSITQIGSAIGPVLAGYVYDLTQSYQLAFIGCVFLGLLAIGITFFIKPLPVKQA